MFLISRKVTSQTVADVLGMIGVIEAIPSPEADVWPTNSIKNILAKTPAGQEVIIGQQVHLKVYSDSARKNLVNKRELFFFYLKILKLIELKKIKISKINQKFLYFYSLEKI